MNRKIPDSKILKASPEELIRTFSPWLRFVVSRFDGFLSRSGVFDAEDLYWVGAMALINAKDSWNPEKGNFLTHSFYAIRSAIQRQLSFGKREIEPESIYLDAPLAEDEELSLIDTIPSGDKGPDEIAEDNDLKEHMQAALDRMEDPLGQKILKKRYYEDKTINETAAALGVEPRLILNHSNKALTRLRRDHKLRDIAFNDYYRRVGLMEFKETFTSEVELALIKKEREFNMINGPGAYTREAEIIKKAEEQHERF